MWAAAWRRLQRMLNWGLAPIEHSSLRRRAQPVREHVELLEAGADDVAVRGARAVGELLAGLGEDGVAAELAGALDADREQRALRAAAAVARGPFRRGRGSRRPRRRAGRLPPRARRRPRAPASSASRGVRAARRRSARALPAGRRRRTAARRTRSPRSGPISLSSSDVSAGSGSSPRSNCIQPQLGSKPRASSQSPISAGSALGDTET